jgi:3-oxoacyl-[acyl-carrier protein] reductase
MSNIIFITGASSDIGLTLIAGITEECLIIAHYNSSNKNLLDLATRISIKLVTIQANLQNEQSVNDMLNHIEETYGVPNKIIHLAAPKFENKRFKDATWSVFQKEIEVSLKSIVIILHRFLPQLAVQKRGRIICMLSSVTLNVPPKALAHYTTVKYALWGLMKSLASEYAEKRITINCISPSMVETKFLSLIDERMIEMIANSHPLKRNATVDEIIPTILLLLSDQSDYINGINIPITGGSNF